MPWAKGLRLGHHGKAWRASAPELTGQSPLDAGERRRNPRFAAWPVSFWNHGYTGEDIGVHEYVYGNDDGRVSNNGNTHVIGHMITTFSALAVALALTGGTA